jgi:hypothetical protein
MDLNGDKKKQYSTKSMDSVDPMVLDSSGNKCLLVFFDYFPEVAKFWYENVVLFNRGFAGESVEIFVKEVVV